MQQSTHALHTPGPLVRSHRDVAMIDAGLSLPAPMVAKLLGLTGGFSAHVPSRLGRESGVSGERDYACGELIGGELREKWEGLWTCVHSSGGGLQTTLKDPREIGRLMLPAIPVERGRWRIEGTSPHSGRGWVCHGLRRLGCLCPCRAGDVRHHDHGWEGDWRWLPPQRPPGR